MKDKKEILDKINQNKDVKITDASIETAKKNKFGLWMVGCLIGLLVIAIIAYLVSDHKVETRDASKFKEEYESYNGKENSNGVAHMDITISEDNPVVYSNYEEVFKLLDSGTGVIYFGFPTCPWCRALLPELLTSAKEAGLEKIYYLNCMEDRDTKSLDEDGKIVTDKEGTEDYYKLVEKLSSVLGSYEGLNDDTIKRLYFPTVIFVKDGKIVDTHIGTLDSQEDPRKPFTEEEKKELQTVLIEKMEKTLLCDNSGC